jgi:hypothetical protein
MVRGSISVRASEHTGSWTYATAHQHFLLGLVHDLQPLYLSSLAPRLHSATYVILTRQSTCFLSHLIPQSYFSLAAPEDKPLCPPFIRFRCVTASIYKASKDLRGSMSFFSVLSTHHIANFRHFTHSHHSTHNFET